MPRHESIIEQVETQPFAHRYLIKRPVVRQQLVAISSSVSLQHTRSSHTGNTVPGEDDNNGESSEGIDNPMVEKRRFELFIDLIWVGIIGNLAEHFSEQAFTSGTSFSIGDAVEEFLILFLIAWRMWLNLSNFTTIYHTNDLVERAFVIWILVLAMVYGNNAPYLLDESKETQTNVAVVIYLISRFSYTVLEGFYSIYLPSHRRGIVLRFLVAIPTTGLWIGALYVQWPTNADLLIAAVVTEFALAKIMEMSFFERWLKEEHARPFDADHWVERVQDFFIIILGEGVLNLIKGSPLGRGITTQLGTGVLALVQYYVLSGLYFNGDQSRRYVHAVKRKVWLKALWMFFHTLMFDATLILGVSVVFLVQHPDDKALLPDPASNPSSDQVELAGFVYRAKWCTSVSLSVTILCLSSIATLSRSLDKPGSLKVTNRYLRLLPRLGLVVVAMCLPIERAMRSVSFLGILVAMLSSTLSWEWYASLEADGKILES